MRTCVVKRTPENSLLFREGVDKSRRRSPCARGRIPVAATEPWNDTVGHLDEAEDGPILCAMPATAEHETSAHVRN